MKIASIKIACWNVAGLRGSIKKGAVDWIESSDYDIVCLQETKCTRAEADKVAPEWVFTKYPHRFWNSCTGEYQHLGFQKKGLSGTAIWSKWSGVQLESAEFDKEGRITAVDFGDFIVVTVYTTNSQSPESDRFRYRVREWDVAFREYVAKLSSVKATVVCGDFNVAHQDRDVYKPDEFKNMVAGFMNEERENFTKLLDLGFIDGFRHFKPDDDKQFTFWDQKLPYLRRTNRGWRIDYFLVPQSLVHTMTECDIHPDIQGSDHCPITLTLALEHSTSHKPKVILKRNRRLRIVKSLSQQ